MGLLEADTAGLHALAASCRSWAVEVQVADMRLPTGLTGQASAGVVATVHAEITTAAAVLAHRLQYTASKLESAGTAYAEQEADAAAKLTVLTTEA